LAAQCLPDKKCGHAGPDERVLGSFLWLRPWYLLLARFALRFLDAVSGALEPEPISLYRSSRDPGHQNSLK